MFELWLEDRIWLLKPLFLTPNQDRRENIIVAKIENGRRIKLFFYNHKVMQTKSRTSTSQLHQWGEERKERTRRKDEYQKWKNSTQ